MGGRGAVDAENARTGVRQIRQPRIDEHGGRCIGQGRGDRLQVEDRGGIAWKSLGRMFHIESLYRRQLTFGCSQDQAVILFLTVIGKR